jgi:hypothetical protein
MRRGIKNIKLMNLKLEKYNPGEDSFLMRSARFIGTTAWRIHKVIANPLVIIVTAIAIAYCLMHLAGISVEIHRSGSVLLTIR